MIRLDEIRVTKRHQKEHDYNKKPWFLFEKQVLSHSATENPTRRVVPEWAFKAKIISTGFWVENLRIYTLEISRSV